MLSKTAHSEYAVYLENEKKKELLAAEEKKRKQEAEEHVSVLKRRNLMFVSNLNNKTSWNKHKWWNKNSARDLISEAAKKLAVAV